MVRLGIVGTGGMAGNHANEFAKIPGVKLVACCDINAQRVAAFAERWKIPNTYSDYREMIDNEPLDGLVNVTIDAMHAPVSLSALAKKIPVLCEKPMATSLADAKKMRDTARKAGVPAMINFSYRNSCGLQAAAKYIAQGKIGRIIHVESSYLQSWLVHSAWGDWHTEPAWQWRLSAKHGSGGALADIGCHILDMTAFLCGDISEIFCLAKTFDKGVRGNRIGEYVFDANDSFVSTVTFANGAIGTIHASRWATGQMNSLRVRVYGDKGAVEVDLDKSYSEYQVIQGADAMKSASWKSVKAPKTPNNYRRFINAIKSGTNDASDFENGAKIQAYLHYCLESNKQKKPLTVTI